MSATLTDKPTDTGTSRRLLRGLPWLVVRQHRIALACVLGLTLLTAIWIVYERHDLVQLLDAKGWPEKDAGQPLENNRGYGYITSIISGLPLILAVFIGAPLIAGDQESGTAQLVTTQSVSRRQWLIAKLGLAYTLALVSGVVLSALFTWWWKPYRSLFPSEWIDGLIFDNTGPVLPAFLLFLTAAGVTIGVLVRRVLPAMVGAFLFTAMTTLFVWDEIRVRIGVTHMFTYPLNSDLPERFNDAYEADRWVGSADGTLYNWGICAEATEKAQNACIKEHGIVNNVIEYLDYSQMGTMQWTAAGILLAGTALLTAFTLWWTSAVRCRTGSPLLRKVSAIERKVKSVVVFRIDRRSGVSTYLQIVRQVEQALRMGALEVGDRLPTAAQVAATTKVNPNTTLKAYRELERMGLAEVRQGAGTFITRTLAQPQSGPDSRCGPR